MDPTSPPDPKLTPAQDAVDFSKPGAGGWTPKPLTVHLLGMTAVVLLPMAGVIPQAFPGPIGMCIGAACGAISGGCVWLAAKSAGPRNLG